MKQWTEELIEECVSQLLSCRDFCGSERDTYMDFCVDHELPVMEDVFNTRPEGVPDGRVEVFERVNQKWNASRKAAGVR